MGEAQTNHGHVEFSGSNHGTTGTSSLHLADIIEISSDEDIAPDNGQPESSRRPTFQAWRSKRAITIDSSDDNDGMQYHYPEPASRKRQKRAHLDLEDNNDLFMMDMTNLEPFEVEALYAPALGQAFPEVDNENPYGLVFGHDHYEIENMASLPGVHKTSTDIDDNQAKTVPMNEGIDVSSPTLSSVSGHKKTSQCPYYYDEKLEACMYRGPGYEIFPVVLDETSVHQDYCDAWDRSQAQKRFQQLSQRRYNRELARFMGDIQEQDDVKENHTILPVQINKDLELELLFKIREVLPDIQRAFAIEKIQSQLRSCQQFTDHEVPMQPNPGDIISMILELPEYPRRDKAREIGEPSSDGTGMTIKCQKGRKDSKSYLRDALEILAAHFHHVPTHYINKVIQETQSVYAAYIHIHEFETKHSNLPPKERPYRRSANPRTILEKKYVAKQRELRSKNEWENMINELQAARQQIAREQFRKAKEETQRVQEEENLRDHRARHSLVECQCCFDEEVPANRTVSCKLTEAHRFCFTCICRLAENQVGSMKYEMNCMHQSGCTEPLSATGIRQALPPKLVERLEFYHQQSDITMACLDGLEQCPFCDFKAICDPVEENSVFHCQNSDCGRVSCRKCHEDNHAPKTCEESKEDRHISARHQVEEARSEAMMRPCPKCKVKIVKELGCNKMRCTRCGCVMCYVCKTDISSRKDGGYGHFHESGAKCILYDKNFNRHEAEADQAEMEAIQKVRAENMDIEEAQIQIETGRKNATSSSNTTNRYMEAIAAFGGVGAAAAERVLAHNAAVLQGRQRLQQHRQRRVDRANRVENLLPQTRSSPVHPELGLGEHFPLVRALFAETKDSVHTPKQVQRPSHQQPRQFQTLRDVIAQPRLYTLNGPDVRNMPVQMLQPALPDVTAGHQLDHQTQHAIMHNAKRFQNQVNVPHTHVPHDLRAGNPRDSLRLGPVQYFNPDLGWGRALQPGSATGIPATTHVRNSGPYPMEAPRSIHDVPAWSNWHTGQQPPHLRTAAPAPAPAPAAVKVPAYHNMTSMNLANNPLYPMQPELQHQFLHAAAFPAVNPLNSAWMYREPEN